jgi:PAS domain S-box-containing protein
MKNRKRFQKMSIANFVIITFITTVFILLVIFGINYYKLEKDRQWSNLQKELSVTAEQLSINFPFPVWTLDYNQIDNIIVSTMSNQNIYGILVNVHYKYFIRARGPKWEIITLNKMFPANGLLIEERNIVHSGETIGSFKLFVSTKNLERNLNVTFLSIMSFIALFVIIIIIGLYFVLHLVVLKPVMNIEQYTMSVSSGENKGLKIKGKYFQGELFTLRTSIEKMVNIHEKRFVELQNEVKLRAESEEKYRDIFNRAIEGIFQSTPEGKFLNINPAMARYFGYGSPDEMINSNLEIQKDIYVNPEDRERFKTALERDEQVEGFESQFFRKDGNIIWMSLNARIVRDPDGKVLYYEGTSVETTMRKNSEDEKEKLQTQLRQAQKMEAIGTLAGGIAHDFNNILSVVSGYTSMLLMALEKGDPMHSYAEQILLAADRATNLTKSLLTFSRKQQVILKPMNLNEVISDVNNLLRRLLTEDIALVENLSDEDTIIMGDITQTDQILLNLVSNARDAMPGGGKLTIETKLVDMDKDFTDMLGYGEPGRYVLLSISDTGRGIDERIKEHIFNPFFTTKDVGKGTGLGLSTVYGIVKQHNGYINVYSELGIGSSFHIYFPAISAVVEKEKKELPVITGGNETILVAEDNESVRNFIKTILSKYGYNIIEAGDGEEALREYNANENIDLIILDSVMPKKNGREVYNEIKKRKSNIKVLFTSGYTRDIILDKGIEENEVEFISKPLISDALLHKVRELLDKNKR